MDRTWVKFLVVVAVFAGVLVPALVAPARTISVPQTIAATKALGRMARAPQRVSFDFPATHIGFSWIGDEGTGVRFRAIDEDGSKGEWQRAPQAHDAERGDQHYSGVIALDRATGLIWQGVRRRAAEMGPVTLDYLNTLDGERYLQRVPALAEAAVGTPDVITRAEWGANESLKRTSGGCRRTFYNVQQLFVHHTAGANFDTHPKATMRAIYWYHTQRQGWCDVGYNFVIAPDGTVYEGRWARNYAPFEHHDSESRDGRVVTGAHVSGFNSGSVGVSLMGNYSQVELPPAARRSLAELLAWEADRHNLKPEGSHTYRNPDTGVRKRLPFIAGHRDAGQTECPGNLVYAALPAIRKDTKAAMGAGKLGSVLTLEATARVIQYGASATFTGVLSDENGAPLPGRPIRSYMKVPGTEWAAGPGALTGADGTYSLTITPRKNTRLLSIYDGDPATWGADSNVARVRVRPEVTLRAEGGTIDAGGFSHYPPGTTSVRLAGEVRPRHPGHDVVLRVSRLNPDGTYTQLTKMVLALDGSSAYAVDYALPDTAGGTFRALTWFKRDEDHPAAPSPEVLFVVDPSP
ncbi:MAG TPA: N-acetylmuramoyl-L-alanine amidase [Actinomycetota bacterium]|nr:N-acetylmuramoyl-L-alanine amidase [Actinomycetota bacterium]